MPRQQGYRHHEDTRKKIQAAQLINRLEKHVFADKPLLDASQVNAAKALLNKVLPDLSSVSVDGEMTPTPTTPLRPPTGSHRICRPPLSLL